MITDGPLILVVDDELPLRRLLEKLLTRSGFGVITAEGGREALTLLEGGAVPAVVLLDLLMAGMNGVEFVQAARERGHEFPTILVSASPEAPGHARDLRLAGHVEKPYRFNVLLSAVQGVLAARPAG